jgi:hypothetical protein
MTKESRDKTRIACSSIPPSLVRIVSGNAEHAAMNDVNWLKRPVQEIYQPLAMDSPRMSALTFITLFSA